MVADRWVGLHLVACVGTLLLWLYSTQVLPPSENEERNRLHASLLWLGILYWAWALLMALVHETRLANEQNLNPSHDPQSMPLPLYIKSDSPNISQDSSKTDISNYQIKNETNVKGVSSEKGNTLVKSLDIQEHKETNAVKSCVMSFVADMTSWEDLRGSRLVWHSNGALSSVLALSCVVYVWALQGSLREIICHYWSYSWSMRFSDQVLLVCLPIILCSLEVVTALIYLLQLLGFMPIDELPEPSETEDQKSDTNRMLPSTVNSAELQNNCKIPLNTFPSHLKQKEGYS